MANFRKRMYPAYKANRQPPARPREVMVLWEKQEMDVSAVLYDPKLDFFFCEVTLTGNESSVENLPHIITAGLISLARTMDCVVVAVREQVGHTTQYNDLDERGM